MISTAPGLPVFCLLGHPPEASALGVGLAITAMLMTGIGRSPAGADPYVVAADYGLWVGSYARGELPTMAGMRK
jgi:CBS-domain-containing membrane protein